METTASSQVTATEAQAVYVSGLSVTTGPSGKGRVLLKQVGFEVPTGLCRGDRLIRICGKSTYCKALAGLLRCDGRILFAGYSVNALRHSLPLAIAYLLRSAPSTRSECRRESSSAVALDFQVRFPAQPRSLVQHIIA